MACGRAPLGSGYSTQQPVIPPIRLHDPVSGLFPGRVSGDPFK